MFIKPISDFTFYLEIEKSRSGKQISNHISFKFLAFLFFSPTYCPYWNCFCVVFEQPWGAVHIRFNVNGAPWNFARGGTTYNNLYCY